MKDAEFIYSLYVQANPVPDPDLLPLTRDEAALLSFERSSDMMTQEETEKIQQGTPLQRRRVVVAIGAAAVLVAAVAVVALLAGGDTTPVAATEAEPVMSFDGSACSYDGPTLIEEGTVTFALTNSANVGVSLGYVRLEDEAKLADELELIPVGSNVAVSSPIPPGTPRFVQMDPGESATHELLMRPGYHVLDCATGDPADHVWRAAQIEVVTP